MAEFVGDREDFYVECGSCDAEGPMRSRKEQAVAAWNLRTGPTGEPMAVGRYDELMNDDSTKLTQEELDTGYHFCPGMDGLLCRRDSDDCFCECGSNITPPAPRRDTGE